MEEEKVIVLAKRKTIGDKIGNTLIDFVFGGVGMVGNYFNPVKPKKRR